MRIARALFASLAGAFLTLALYLAWFFKITGHKTPWDGASMGFIVLTAVVAAGLGFFGGWLAASLSPETSRGSAEGAAGFIALAAIFAEANTPGQHHFAQMIALLVAAPVAYFLGRARRRPMMTRSYIA
jgi:hypothetical protein